MSSRRPLWRLPLDHAGNGGARERWDESSGPEGTKTAARGAICSPAEDCSAIAVAGGCGSAALSIRRPVQQSPMQVLLVPSSGEGAGLLAPSLWQMTKSDCAAAAAAAICAAPKFAIRPDSAIA